MPSCQRCSQLLAGVVVLLHLGSLIQGQTLDLGHDPSDLQVLYEGPEYQPFDRPLPSVVETSLFQEFEDYFNQTVDFSAKGSNTYHPSGRQVVVAITNGYVTGVLGDVYDSAGRIYREFSTSAAGPSPINEVNRQPCKRFRRLATAIQKYGHMYYHFIQEVLPRIVLLQPHLDEHTKILSFGSDHEFKWLAELGISPAQIEVYDPTLEYCADELLVPSISPIITPPKENYELVRAAFHVDTLDALDEDDSVLIYCSRRDARERVVANEEALLSAIARTFPQYRLHVFTGQESAAETIQLFSRAQLVVGMHGAGLSHLLFSPPGVAVVEFLFMPDPPLMFWHAAAALRQRYVMVPLAQSWWLDQHVHVPEQDVIDAIYLTLEPAARDCELGFFRSAVSGACMPCASGTYRPAGASTCLPCAAGRVAETAGAAFCSTCQAGAYAAAGLQCVPCAEEEATLLPGASSKDMCISVDDANQQFEDMFSKDALTAKLVSLPALELPRPQGLWQWIVAMLSPQRWRQLWQYRQLQYRYINDLFSSDVHMRDLAMNGAQGAGDDSDPRHGARRRAAISYGARRQAIAGGYAGLRRSLAAGYGAGARRLITTMYGARRSLSGNKRWLRSGVEPGSRLTQIARRLQQSTLNLLTHHSTLPGSRMVQQRQDSFWQSTRSILAWVWRVMRQ